MSSLAKKFEENQEKEIKLDSIYEPMIENFGMLTNFHDLIKPSERRMLAMLFDMELKHRSGNPKFKDGVFPGIKKIAKVTKNSERTVQYFFSKIRKDAYLSFLLKIEARPRTSNLYQMSEILFLFLGYLKMEGALYQWNKHKKRILGYVHKSNDIIIKRLELRFEKLSTSVLHHPPPSFCTLLNVFTKYFRGKYKVPTASASEVLFLEKEFDQITFNFGRTNLRLQQKKYFLRNFPLMSLQKAIEDTRFYKEKGNLVKSDFALIHSRVKYHDLVRV